MPVGNDKGDSEASEMYVDFSGGTYSMGGKSKAFAQFGLKENGSLSKTYGRKTASVNTKQLTEFYQNNLDPKEMANTGDLQVCNIMEVSRDIQYQDGDRTAVVTTTIRTVAQVSREFAKKISKKKRP